MPPSLFLRHLVPVLTPLAPPSFHLLYLPSSLSASSLLALLLQVGAAIPVDVLQFSIGDEDGQCRAILRTSHSSAHQLVSLATSLNPERRGVVDWSLCTYVGFSVCSGIQSLSYSCMRLHNTEQQNYTISEYTTVSRSILQYPGVYYSISEYTTVSWSILQCLRVYYSILEYTTVSQSILQYPRVYYSVSEYTTVSWSILQCLRVYYSIPEYTTVSQSILQYPGVYYSVSEYTTVFQSILQYTSLLLLIALRCAHGKKYQ